MQNMNNQMPQGQSWPWMPNNEADKSIDVPKSMSYPIPSNGMSNFDAMYQQKSFPQGPPQPEMWSPNNNQDPMNQNSQFGAEDFPYNRPYRNQFGGQGQGPMMMQQPPPPPQGMPPNMYHMNNMYGMGPPQPRSFGGGQGMNPNRIGGGRSTNSPPEFYPPSTPFDFLNPRYPIEYSPLKTKNTSAITIHYNVTYTFSPMGWKPIDVSVSDADFHSSISDRSIDTTGMMGMPLMTPGGGIMPVPQQNNEMKNPDQGGPMSGLWWPKKTGSEIDDKIPSGIDQSEMMPPTGFGQ